MIFLCQHHRAEKMRGKSWRSPGLAHIAFLLAVLSCHATAQTNEILPSPTALKKLSLEELMDIEVTSVSKRAEKLSETASAIQVVTGEDIRRSGAASLPEALRLAANLQVAQVDSRQWAISARGFNNTLANKLLVMIDGRTIYTPLYAGVFWDVQQVLLEDIDQIEVISGSGGTLWGANAVNGVINIVTKSARDTQGTLVTGGGGSLLQDFGAVRYGDRIGSNLFFRVYGQHFDRDSTRLPGGNAGTNAWGMTQGGLRVDWYPSEANTLTVQGDGYGGAIEQPASGDTTVDGQNLLGRWTHTFSSESDLQVQMYFDRTWRDIPNTFAEDLKTYDFDFQHRFPIGERQSIMWGGGYRLMQDEVANSAALAFLPSDRNMQLFGGFLQDEITLISERLKFTIGTKLEHNDFSGFEFQPSGRLAWTPDERQTIWGAISRAVRSPSRIDTDFFTPPPPVAPGTPNLAGGPTFDSETVIAYELGYRVRPIEKMSLSLAAFFNDYDDLRSLEQTAPNTFEFRNGLHGESWGVELSGTFQATPWWRLRGGYTYLEERISQKPGHTDLNQGRGEGNDPRHQCSLQSILDLPAHFQFDVTARYVDALPFPAVPGYFTFDARLAWQFKHLELSVVGQNLWDDSHPEFGAAATRQEIPRSIYGKVTFRW
jgi:iron complex outermembrane receptor protein